ncbi:MAG: hypothetical protein ABI053_03020 [Lacisediminihabitans sp.]
MRRSTEAPTFVVRVSPRRSLMRNGLLSYALLSLPLFGAVYFFSTLGVTWLIAVLGIHLLTLAAAAILYWRFTAIFIGVTPTAIYERTLLRELQPMQLSDVGEAVLVSTYRSSSPDTMLQLLVRCTNNKRALRMRGMFWSQRDMRAIATVIAASTDIAMDERDEPITARDFFAQYPGCAYWYENRPVIVVMTAVVSMLAVFGFVLAFMALMGIPIIRA